MKLQELKRECYQRFKDLDRIIAKSSQKYKQSKK